MYYHSLQVLGRSTGDVELSKSKAGRDYAKMTVAVNQRKSKDDETEQTYFYDVLLFGKKGESASKLVKKGDLVFVYGRPDFEAYLSKKKKEPRINLTLLADNWQLIK